MTIFLYLLLIGGLLIFMSQASYAYIIAKVDISTSERRIHCLHHAVHSSCGLLTLFAALAVLIGLPKSLVATVYAIAVGLLMIDTIAFLICNKTQQFAIRRDAIKHKWQGEKVFGPEHDKEVSVYRTLKEITEKNLLRDLAHIVLFVILFLISLA